MAGGARHLVAGQLDRHRGKWDTTLVPAASRYRCIVNPGKVCEPGSGGEFVREIQVEVNGAFDSDYQFCDVWHGSPSKCNYTCYDPKWGNSTGVGRDAVCAGSSSECQMAPTPWLFNGHVWDFWNF